MLVGKIHEIYRPDFMIRYLLSVGYCQRALVSESEMIIAQMGKHNWSVMATVHGTPFAIPHHKNNTNTTLSAGLYIVIKNYVN
jgi:hypothetical protein